MREVVGEKKVAHVLAIGTNQELGAIDDICRALARQWIEKNGKSTKELKIEKRRIQKTVVDKEERKQLLDNIKEQIDEYDKFNEKLNNPYALKQVNKIKSEYKIDKDNCKKTYPEVFYYFDGIVGIRISQSMHPAGSVCSSITLDDNYGILINNGERIIQLDMDAVHEVNLVKYDILKLKSVSVLKQICDFLGQPYPHSYEIDWNDEAVWDDLADDNLAIPQYESAFSGQLIATMRPRNIEELAIINAAIRPAGASYRDALVHRISNKTTNPAVDKALSSTLSYLVFQEEIMQFLQQFCGFSGSESDDTRRAIGSKRADVIEATIPKIIDGYCEHRDLPREQAEKEAEEYVQVIKDASSYAFNKSHAVAYSMLGYIFAYMKHYHPKEFICAFLNCADNEDDIKNGTLLAIQRNITIKEPKFRYGQAKYSFDKDSNTIYKGMGSIKYLNDNVAEQLYTLRDNQYNNFFDVLHDVYNKTTVNSRQLDILIKLDFFSEFGNAKLLCRYVDFYNKFTTSGNKFLKSVSKEFSTNEMIMNIIARHSKETKTRYTLVDMRGMFVEFNELLQSANIQDFNLKDKIATQIEYLGYISIKTEKDYDRNKLFVVGVKPLVAKKGKGAGNIWARVITTHSIGRGIDGEWMIKESDYQRQYHFNKDDIIVIDTKGIKKEIYNDRKQWWITRYELYV